MRYLLLPFTMFIWFLFNYLSLYYGALAIIYLFDLNWFLLLLSYPFVFGLIHAIANVLTALIRIYTLKLYNFSWFSIIMHVLSGLTGLLLIIWFFIEYPPQYMSDGKAIFFLKAWWSYSPIKTIFFIFPLLGLISSLLWSTIVVPLALKSDGEFQNSF